MIEGNVQWDSIIAHITLILKRNYDGIWVSDTLFRFDSYIEVAHFDGL